jgi:hypothetical protein
MPNIICTNCGNKSYSMYVGRYDNWLCGECHDKENKPMCESRYKYVMEQLREIKDSWDNSEETAHGSMLDIRNLLIRENDVDSIPVLSITDNTDAVPCTGDCDNKLVISEVTIKLDGSSYSHCEFVDEGKDYTLDVDIAKAITIRGGKITITV